MSNRFASRPLLLAGLLVLCLGAVFGTVPALAGTGTAMPWDPLLDALVTNIGGTTLRQILILAIIGAGIGFYFANEGTWLRSAFGLVIGFSIAVAAATWGPTFFGLAAAATASPTLPVAITWGHYVSLGLRLGTWMLVVSVAGWRLRDLWDKLVAARKEGAGTVIGTRPARLLLAHFSSSDTRHLRCSPEGDGR